MFSYWYDVIGCCGVPPVAIGANVVTGIGTRSPKRARADVRLAYTEIHAPIDGIVDVRAALPGEVVNPGQPVVTLINQDDLWVRVDIEETYIDRVRNGDKLTVRLPSGA